MINSDSKIFIVAGKNPKSPGGYSSYSNALIKRFKREKRKVKVFYINSAFFKGYEMAGLAFLAPILAIKIAKNVEKGVVIWGIGPWSLSGALLKLIYGKKISLYSDYFTTIKHEFAGTLAATDTGDYGLVMKIKNRLANATIISLYGLFERFIMAKSDKVITHYESTEKILKKEFGVKQNKFHRIRNYYPIKKLTSNRQIKPQIPIVLSLSRQDARKGINFLLRAVKILNTRNLRFEAVIAGNGQMLEANKQLALKLGINNVTFPGYIKNRNKLFSRASVFVLPSLEEGSSSLTALEASSAGIPIIATNVDGIIEDFDQKATLVPPANSRILAKAIAQKISELER